MEGGSAEAAQEGLGPQAWLLAIQLLEDEDDEALLLNYFVTLPHSACLQYTYWILCCII